MSAMSPMGAQADLVSLDEAVAVDIGGMDALEDSAEYGEEAERSLNRAGLCAAEVMALRHLVM